MKERIRNAIDFIKGGLTFRVENLGLRLNKSGDIEVSGWSRVVKLKNLNRRYCLQELEEIKEEFREMVNISNELEEFIIDRMVVYYLNYDDSGKTSIAICSEINRTVKWHIDVK
jgi:hypothetical protein